MNKFTVQLVTDDAKLPALLALLPDNGFRVDRSQKESDLNHVSIDSNLAFCGFGSKEINFYGGEKLVTVPHNLIQCFWINSAN